MIHENPQEALQFTKAIVLEKVKKKMLSGKLRKIPQKLLCGAFASSVDSSNPPNPNLIVKDFVGPPDKLSNLRPIVRHISKNETPLQKKLRLLQTEVEEYNQKFWVNHNKRFFEEREEFITATRKHPEENLSADQMSVFYKAFLDKNWKIHVYYNISWYIKNISLMFLAMRVELARMTGALRRKNET